MKEFNPEKEYKKLNRKFTKKHLLIITSVILVLAVIGISFANYSVNPNSILIIDSKVGEFVTQKVYTFEYQPNFQEFIVPITGEYQIELWGAQGGDIDDYLGGRGAYTKGTITLNKGETIYVYVGGAGSNTNAGGYNGGGNLSSGQQVYGSSGGGATDIRLTGGQWDDFESLKSRIMVAAGGGGANNRNRTNSQWMYGAGNGGAGGGLKGIDGEAVKWQTEGNIPTYNWHSIGTGATQTSGGERIAYNSNNEELSKEITGAFGKMISVIVTAQAGGGGGYYTGGAGNHGGAGGGSSFISGHTGCDAITEDSTENEIKHTGEATHYSQKVFTNTEMKAGNQEMPNHEGNDIMIGNEGNGYAKITII